MGKKVYVGNLTDSALEELFAAHGTVQVIMDRDTGRSKAFGFVENRIPGPWPSATPGAGAPLPGRADRRLTPGMQEPPLAHRAVEAVFWLLLLAGQLPTTTALWLAAGALKLSDPFRAYAVALVRWPWQG
jgi:hypothetical protein